MMNTFLVLYTLYILACKQAQHNRSPHPYCALLLHNPVFDTGSAVYDCGQQENISLATLDCLYIRLLHSLANLIVYVAYTCQNCSPASIMCTVQQGFWPNGGMSITLTCGWTYHWCVCEHKAGRTAGEVYRPTHADSYKTTNEKSCVSGQREGHNEGQ